MKSSPPSGSLLVIFLTVFVDLLGFGIVIPLLPIYAQQFTVDERGIQLGLLMASFSAMQFLFAPIWGRLSDRLGRRPILMIGLAGSVVFYTLFAVASIASSLALLFVSRVGAGIFGATISTAQAYIADSTSLEKRPKGMALIGMAFGFGFTLGPLVGLLSVLRNPDDPGPWPGCLAAGLSAIALLLAWFRLPESRHEASESAARKLVDLPALRQALFMPSIGLLLVAVFVCIFSFANLETTLSMLIKGLVGQDDPFNFSFRQVFLTYAYIGLTLAVVQGFFMRRLAGRISEGTLAATGAAIQVVGFILIATATNTGSAALLLVALAIVVSGFAIMQPSLNSLLSRRSDPERQGGILGVGQSVNSLARILGAGVGIPLLKAHILLPFIVGATIMAGGLLLVVRAARSGSDFPQT